MEPIQMVDLKRQYHKIKTQISVAVQEVLDNAAFINGKPVQEFAENLQRYLDIRHVIPCANGTDALQVALMALELQPGDEVITPSFSFIATAEVIALLRLKPVFVDIDPHTFCMDANLLEKAITSRTKAIIPVHLYGQSADMEPILEIASKHGISVIEDNAQATGSDYTFNNGVKKKTGTMGTIACTSFFPSKNLGCYGDGGALFTNDDTLAGKIRMIVNHGQSARYYHEIVGCNSRLDTLQAAVLNVKLAHLDEYAEARRKAAGHYDKAFASHPRITIPYRAANTRHVFHQYTLQLDGVDRNRLQTRLAEQGIPSMIYYPVPAHRQKMFTAFGGAAFDLPVTDLVASRVISLPIHTEMDEEQLAYITSKTLEFLS